ncbi:hypothetical protein DSM104443_01098 [Usitatibacter rugosus]|uniref:CAAX prenyl protease 2/Lysostaphin resistance protein A-like domain-containing protein n=1 Tax=Usitatibacter rugosus TaxID=2732067 RepID=A0A6M4GWR6_9PROT|nr:type II CAAX endopeptidase family protein [Usitatibacter rugosus]QJR10047.1 hypothetical protein DSM104443_01098 [Usitatibacter rugosus]
MRSWIVGALAPVWALVMVVATALLGSWMLEQVVAIDAKGNPLDPIGLVAYTIVPFGLLLLLLLAWVRFVEKRGADAIGFTGPGKLRTFGVGYAIGLASMLGLVAAIWACGGFIVAGPATAVSSPFSLLVIVALAFSLALQSSVEELLFRGWLLTVLSKRFNAVAGVIVSSALFTLLHFSRSHNLLDFTALFLFGVFCCCWTIRSGNVLGPMGWHSGWNWLLAVGFGLPLSGIDVHIPSLLVSLETVGERWLTGGAQGPESSVLCVGYFLAGVALLLRRQPRG